MDPVSAKELAAILTVFVSLIEELGAGGLVGVFFGCPILMMALFYFQSWNANRHAQKMFEETRKYIWELWEKHRGDLAELQEAHRRESAAVLKELGDGLAQTTRYYENNVILVQNYEKMARDLQDLIVTTVQAVSQMKTQFETFCQTLRGVT